MLENFEERISRLEGSKITKSLNVDAAKESVYGYLMGMKND